MGEEPASAAPAHYRAFISYSHIDAGFARWLHRRLEAWRLPDKSRLAPVFIDRAELSAGSDLSAKVREALAESSALIIVASPNARASRWVNQEIELFRELHPGRPVLAALIAGEPAEAFPPALCQIDGKPVEPLAADFRKGQDGKRLGLLKIAAGLTGLPLDQLVQRDAQARQRRVMWITAGALLLSLILAALLVFALRARAEAERQRAEAEGLVEFMLTDLRDKLKGVGRLDVMDAVNERAMAHYQKQADLGGLPDDMLLRRSKVLQAMGADDLDRSGQASEKRAIRLRATRSLEEAWRETGELLVRSPAKREYILAHAQSEFYLGMLGFTEGDDRRSRDFGKARQHWKTYQTLAYRLAASSPVNDSTATREVAYAEGAICSLELTARQRLQAALEPCQAARVAMERLHQQDPDALSPALEYANQLGWEADSLIANGKGNAAIKVRLRQVEIAEATARRFPRDARAQKAAMLARIGQAQTLLAEGQIAQARSAAMQAQGYVARLRQFDPENQDWVDRELQISQLISQTSN